MDAEFGVPWFLSTLDRRGKQFLIDVPKNAYVYKTNPQLAYCPKEILELRCFILIRETNSFYFLDQMLAGFVS